MVRRFFASCIFSEPHAARFRPASEIRTKATPCGQVSQTSNMRRLRLGEEKRRKKNKSQHENILVCPTPQGDHNQYRETTNRRDTHRQVLRRALVLTAPLSWSYHRSAVRLLLTTTRLLTDKSQPTRQQSSTTWTC